MENYNGFQYQLQGMGEQNPATSATSAQSSVRLSTGTASETDTSFDSGFLSPSKSANFTAISGNPRGVGYSHHSPAKVAGSSGVGELIARPGWSEDIQLGGVSDDWDRHFINNFQENLFGFDAAELNNMVDGILRSPFKSPQSSPFKSPRQGRGGVVGLGFSPFKSLSTSNVMLSGPKRSPVRIGGSPFKSPFSSPSPGKSGLGPYTRSSPLTRQRRLILQSPGHKPGTSAPESDPFPELPELLADIKEEIAEDDDLGVTPFQRHNSFGFIPQEEEEASTSFSESFSAIAAFAGESSHSEFLEIQQENDLTPVHTKRGGRREGARKKTSTPSKAASTPGKSSITKHSQVITTLHSKDALRLVRARFKEILDRATEDAIVKEKNAKKKASVKKPSQYPEIASALSKPASKGSGKMQDCDSVQSYATGHSQRGVKRRQEIRPKLEINWQINEPVRIAPKKRKR
nr:hypothetical protein BaRGS_020086 [Batillaria attramentaria]